MMPFDIKHIEAVMKLMEKYAVDEYSSEHFKLTRSAHLSPKTRKPAAGRATEAEPSESPKTNELLARPWDQIPDEALDRFSINGRLGD